MSVATSVAAVLALTVPASGETVTARRGRWHFTLTGSPLKAYSILFLRMPAGDETRLLVETDAGRFDLLSKQTTDEKDSTESVRDVATGETLSRRLLFGGYEKVPGCEPVKPPDACVLFEAPAGKVPTSLSRIAGPDGPAIRAKLLATLPEAFRAKLLALEPSFDSLNEFHPYGDDFLGLVFPGRFKDPRAVPPRGRRSPGCAFDRGFGFPCSEAEQKREDARYAPKP